MASLRFEIPEDAPIYVDAIIERCENLINHGIWNGLHIAQLRKWLANFSTEEERYFSACVLDSLIYRSKDQTVSLLRHLFQRVLPDLSRVDPFPVSVSDLALLRQPRSAGDPGIRLVPVVRPDDPPTKSGHVVARLFKQHIGISEAWIVPPSRIRELIKSRVPVYLFIDDFLGTGDQFQKFVTAHGLASELARVYAAYVPLVAHEDGVKHLNKLYPNLRLRPVELLDDSHCLFRPASQCFSDGHNSPESAKAFYYGLLRRNKIAIEKKHRLGYGRLELAYAFEHAVPDNSLPILWWSKSPAWNPLFKR